MRLSGDAFGTTGPTKLLLVGFYAGLALLTASVSFTNRQPDMKLPVAIDHLERGWRLLVAPQAVSDEDRNYPNAYAAAKRPLMPALTKALSTLGLPLSYSFEAIRLLSIWVGYLVFHSYLRRWFDLEQAILGTLYLGASAPLTFLKGFEILTDFPEIAFTCLILGAMVNGHTWRTSLYVLLATFNRETTLSLLPLAIVYWLVDRGPRAAFAPVCAFAAAWAFPVIALSWRVGVYHDPAFLYQATTSHNLAGLARLGVNWNPFNNYLYYAYLFGALWVLPVLAWRQLPKFLRLSLVIVPVHVFFLTTLGGMLDEPRQLMILYPVLVPPALVALRGLRNEESHA